MDWAYITNIAVDNADITSLSADKITSGTIDASSITVTNLDADNITSGTLNVTGGEINFVNGPTISGLAGGLLIEGKLQAGNAVGGYYEIAGSNLVAHGASARPGTDRGADLGSSSYYWSKAYIGTLYITNTGVVSNLNADQLDGYDAGNALSDIPISNNTKCTGLNADEVDGYGCGGTVAVRAAGGGTVNCLKAEFGL